jgi:hypothetical protein
MMRSLKGKALISILGKEFPVSVFFNLDRGRCEVSDDERGHINGSLGMLIAFGEEIFLRNVMIKSSKGSLCSEELGPFLLYTSILDEAPENSGIPSSGIATALGVKPLKTEANKIILRPLNSRITFDTKNLKLGNESEILFHCEAIREIDCTMSMDGGEVRVHNFPLGSPFSEYVRCCSSSLKLSEYINILSVALSLFLRRKAFLHSVRDQNEISINLAPPDRAISYGILVSDPRRYQEMLERLLSHSSHRRRYFLIEAFSNPGPVEVRLLNAFVHLEIIDGGKTLSSNRISSVLEISRENADALVSMRNIMIHSGFGVKAAMEECRSRLQARKGGPKKAEILENSFKTRSPHGNFYSALMDALSRHLAKEVGVPSDWIQRNGTLSF